MNLLWSKHVNPLPMNDYKMSVGEGFVYYSCHLVSFNLRKSLKYSIFCQLHTRKKDLSFLARISL